MGLTIHYAFTTKITRPKSVRQLVATIRQFALDLPFAEVSEVKEYGHEEVCFDQATEGDERWLKIQAEGSVAQDDRYYRITPRHIIAFSTRPGQGCEDANFGFCHYPSFINTVVLGRKRRLTTNLSGWRWSSFCKTQYASDPACGGVQNFLRCHLCVGKLLDFIKQTGLVTAEVRDEGEYWESRNMERLAREVGDWNEFIAGFAGTLQSVAESEGKTIEAPILNFPNFEHLEAKGIERLADLRRNLGLDENDAH